MQPFQWQLWATLFSSVFVVGTAMYLLDSLSPFLRYSPGYNANQQQQQLQRQRAPSLDQLTDQEYRFVTEGRPVILDGLLVFAQTFNLYLQSSRWRICR